MGGKGPKALERVARAADGWLTANVTPDEAGRGRDTIAARAEALGRTIDDEHYGISVPYARSSIPPPVEEALRARRPDGSITDIAPIGAGALTALLGQHIERGLVEVRAPAARRHRPRRGPGVAGRHGDPTADVICLGFASDSLCSDNPGGGQPARHCGADTPAQLLRDTCRHGT